MSEILTTTSNSFSFTENHLKYVGHTTFETCWGNYDLKEVCIGTTFVIKKSNFWEVLILRAIMTGLGFEVSVEQKADADDTGSENVLYHTNFPYDNYCSLEYPEQ